MPPLQWRRKAVQSKSTVKNMEGIDFNRGEDFRSVRECVYGTPGASCLLALFS
jgi:hypothetical protein